MLIKVKSIKKLNNDHITVILGLVAWIIVIGSLPIGDPVPIYAGY